MIRTLLIFSIGAVCFKTTAVASDDFRAATSKDRYAWPKGLFQLDPKKFVDVTIDLPRIDDNEATDDDKAGKTTRSVYYIDLNEDGIKEMMVPLGQDGQQEDMGIFQLREKEWVDIGTFENGCSFLPKWNGYYQLEDSGYGGGGVTSRRLLRFIRGKYREVRDEIYERGKLDQVRINPDGLDN